MVKATATTAFKEKARSLGFSHVGIARAERLTDEASRLQEWLGRGYHGSMSWMENPKRMDPCSVLPGARSVIAVAMNYYSPHQHSADPRTGKISRYAWGDDYHDILGERLRVLWDWMQKEFPGIEGRYYVDTGPMMDKVWAQRAGIGWIGKHTNLITQDRGSWVFLGQIITTLELEYDTPGTDHCGSCMLCIAACPTDAIVEPYVVDSNRCISYLTIEHRGDINPVLGEKFERWIYGCDICQDVCPWNEKFAVPTDEQRFSPRPWNEAPDLDQWEDISQEEFTRLFKGSPVKRTKREGLVRNVRAVSGRIREGKNTT